MKKSKINWEKTSAAVFRADLKRLRAVAEFDAQNLDDLVGLDAQKIILCENTQKFLDGIGGTNALLWGERGCGKSSLCKGVFTKFMKFNLKVIEISRDDLKFLPRILDQIRELPYKFIIYCDDLSFETGENGYKFLRPLLDGSIEKAPQNVLMYATSNRRHIVTEHASDNATANVHEAELHLGDAVQEKLSLSDRFGIWLSFYEGDWAEYLRIIDSYFGFENSEFSAKFGFISADEREILHEQAKRYAMLKSSRNGRTAKQFFLNYGAKFLQIHGKNQDEQSANLIKNDDEIPPANSANFKNKDQNGRD